MKSFTSVATVLFLSWSTVQGQENVTAPSLALVDDAPSFVPSTQFATTPVGIVAASPSNASDATPLNTPVKAPVTTPVTSPVAAPVKAPVLFPTGPANAGSNQCKDNDVCAALGLIGACCPTVDDQYLDCCGGVQEDTCVRNARCNALGLTGTCCPTAGHRRPKLNGITLDCCDTVPDACGPTGNQTAPGNQTAQGNSTTPGACVRMSAKEFQLELAAQSSSASRRRRSVMTSLVMILASVWMLG